MANVNIYPEMSYGSWEYRQERLAWENAYHSKARNNSWNNRYRCNNGSYSSYQILQFICDHTVNAEYKDFSMSPYYIRKNHTFPVPEFRLSNDSSKCRTFLKKKFINQHQESSGIRSSTSDTNMYVFECYPHNSDDWYEDYMNSTHMSDGSHETADNCKNSRLLGGTGNKMVQDLVKDHGGHLNLVYNEYTSLDQIPNPTIEYTETFDSGHNNIPGFEKVYLGQPVKITPFGDVLPTIPDVIAYTAYNTDASYGSLSKYPEPNKEIVSAQKFARTGTVKEAFDLLFTCYNNLRVETESFPEYESMNYPVVEGAAVEDLRWTAIKDNPCSIFIGDNEHSLQHILDYLCETFEMHAYVSGTNIQLAMGISETAYVQTINFGKNLLDYSTDVDVSTIVTAVCPYMINITNADEEIQKDNGRLYILPGPYWHNQYKTEGKNYNNQDILVDRCKYVFSEQLVSEYGWVTDVLEFDYEDWKKSTNYTISGIADLKIAARNFLQEQGNIYLKEQLSKSLQSFSISAIDLAYMGEKDVPLHIGDLVRCISPLHDLDKVLAVTEIKLDFAHPEKTSYTLGNPSVKKSISHMVGKKIDKQG